MMTCRICSSALRPHLKKNGYDVFKCSECGFGQVNITAEGIAEYYDQAYYKGEKTGFSQEENVDISLAYRYWIEENLSRFPERNGLRVLEIGPGLGAPVGGYFQRVHPNIEYAAIEISDYACERLATRGFKVFNGRVTNSETVNACRGKYDLIFGIEVIEHDPEPHAFMRAVHAMLKPAGWAGFVTGNFTGLMARMGGKDWYYLDPPSHVSFYTPKAMTRVLNDEGFGNTSIKRYGFHAIELKVFTHLPGILACAHLANFFTGMSIAAQRQ
jgi:SAM-dependent methyltransferase